MLARIARLAVLVVTLALVAIGCVSLSSIGSSTGAGLSSTTVEDGAKLYKANCASCHGDAGDRVPVAPLTSGVFLDSRGDATLEAVITGGKGVMPAWGKARGGPLNETQVRAILAFISSAADRASPTLLADAGRAIYVDQCVTCHGDAGDRVPVAPLHAKAFLDTRSDAQLVDVIARGSGVMPAFGKRPGVAAGLSDEQVRALAAYLRANVDAGVAGRVDRGRTLYVNNCLSCHGEKGDRIPDVKLASADFLSKEGDATLAQVALDGKGGMPGLMRARNSSFDVEDVGALLAYLKTWAGLPAGMSLAGTPTAQAQPAGSTAPSAGVAPALTTLPTGAASPSTAAPASPAATPGVAAPPATLAPLTASERALVSHGKALFSQNCTICHGESNEQLGKLANGTWLLQRGDTAIAETIVEGKTVPGAGQAMPAFGKDKGGPLTNDDIPAVIAYLKSVAGVSLTTAPTRSGPDPAHGKEIFGNTCAACHGAQGDQLPTAKLNDAAFLQQRGNQGLTQVITSGKGGMPAFGGKLSADDVAAVIAFLDTQAGIAPDSTGVGPAAGRPAGGGSPPATTLVAQGKDLFGANCAVCHGPKGDQQPTAKLNDPNFLQQRGDQTLTRSITNGKGGMPAWGTKLSPDDISTVLSYIKSLAGVSGGGASSNSPAAAAPTAEPTPPPASEQLVDVASVITPAAGRELFKTNCAACHGEDGQRIPQRLLLSPDFGGAVSAKQLNTWITGGTPGGAMPAFGVARGGPLTAPQIASIVAYIKEAAGASPPPQPSPDNGAEPPAAVTPE